MGQEGWWSIFRPKQTFLSRLVLSNGSLYFRYKRACFHNSNSKTFLVAKFFHWQYLPGADLRGSRGLPYSTCTTTLWGRLHDDPHFGMRMLNLRRGRWSVRPSGDGNPDLELQDLLSQPPLPVYQQSLPLPWPLPSDSRCVSGRQLRILADASPSSEMSFCQRPSCDHLDSPLQACLCLSITVSSLSAIDCLTSSLSASCTKVQAPWEQEPG